MKISKPLLVTIGLAGMICAFSIMLTLINVVDSEATVLVSIIVMGASGVLFLVFRIIIKTIRRKRAARAAGESLERDGRTGFFTAESGALLFFAIVGKFILNILAKAASHGPAIILIILLNVLLLAILGVLYSRWADSAEYAPVLAVVVLTVVDSFFDLLRFTSNPSAQFRFGPEIFWFAAARFSGRLAVLPLFAVLAWGSWKISDMTRIREFGSMYLFKRPDN
jgi:hypothetical protein